MASSSARFSERDLNLARKTRSLAGWEYRKVGGHQVNPQKIARLFGWLFIATFVTSIGAKILFVNGVGGSFSELRFIPGAVSENSVYLGAILEFGVIVTNIATAVVIYPIVKRQSEKVALGYVTVSERDLFALSLNDGIDHHGGRDIGHDDAELEDRSQVHTVL